MKKVLLLVALVVVFIAGCDKSEVSVMPEVSNENCKPENIAKIKDKESQQTFSSQCLRRSGGFKPSPKREW